MLEVLMCLITLKAVCVRLRRLKRQQEKPSINAFSTPMTMLPVNLKRTMEEAKGVRRGGKTTCCSVPCYKVTLTAHTQKENSL